MKNHLKMLSYLRMNPLMPNPFTPNLLTPNPSMMKQVWNRNHHIQQAMQLPGLRSSVLPILSFSFFVLLLI